MLKTVLYTLLMIFLGRLLQLEKTVKKVILLLNHQKILLNQNYSCYFHPYLFKIYTVC